MRKIFVNNMNKNTQKMWKYGKINTINENGIKKTKKMFSGDENYFNSR